MLKSIVTNKKRQRPVTLSDFIYNINSSKTNTYFHCVYFHRFIRCSNEIILTLFETDMRGNSSIIYGHK